MGMAQAEIGALRVRLAFDAGEFKKGVAEAETSLNKFAGQFGLTSGQLKVGMAAFAAAATAAFAAVAVGVKAAIDEMDELDELAQKVGISTEALSALTYAAKITSIPLESLAVSLKKLAVNLAEIASGDNTTKTARALDAMGIAALDANGNLRSQVDILGDIAEKFKGYEDGATKTALAVAIFGKSGADMILMLNDGREGLAAMSDEARRLGLILDKDTGEAAGRFNDNLMRISLAVQGMFHQIAERILPALVAFTDGMVQNSKRAESFKTVFDGIAFVFKVVLSAIEMLVTAFNVLMIKISGFVSVIASLATMDITGAFDAFKKTLVGIDEQARISATTLHDMWLGPVGAAASAEEGGQRVVKAQAPVMQSTDAMSEAQRAHNQIMEEGKRLTEQYLTPLEQLAVQQEKISKLFKEGAITAVTYGRAMAQASAFSAKNMDALASSVSSNLSAIFGETKAVAIATALINTYQGITKALADYPPPVSFVMAALQAAAGFAQVANIRSATKTSSGGGGGVSSSAAGAASAQAIQSAPQQALMVQGISSDQMFSGDVVRSLANKLVEFQQDGGRVVIA